MELEGVIFTAIQVELPNTNVYMISNEIGYIIGASINMSLNHDFTGYHYVIAANVMYANMMDDLLNQPITNVTEIANQLYGWKNGMLGKEALLLIA